MFELSKVENWIFATLTSGIDEIDAAVKAGTILNPEWRIFPYQIPPQRAKYPAIIYSYQGGGDIQPLGVNRVMSQPLYLIKLISEGRPNDVERAATHAMDEKLGRASREIHDGYAFSSRREQPIKYVENDPSNTSQSYHHCGGLYRVWVHAV